MSLRRRRERWWRRMRPLLVVVALLVGLWLGGHPHLLPAPVADAFVDADVRVVAEAIDKVESTYIEEVDAGRLTDAAIAGIVRRLDDEFSGYLARPEHARLQDASHDRSASASERPSDRAGVARAACHGGLAGRSCGHHPR